MPYLKHKQHLTIGGKPLVIIFDARGGEKEGFAAVQDEARKAGLPGLAIAACGPGAVETGYTHSTHYNIVPGWNRGSEQHKFQEMIEVHRKSWKGSAQQPHIPCLTVGWDKRPWETAGKPGEAWYYPDRTPEQVAAGVRDAIEWVEKHPEQATAEKLIVLYAWNEFGEGGYLAPTKGDPEGKFLKAIKSVVLPTAP
jgi:hypothetical protein